MLLSVIGGLFGHHSFIKMSSWDDLVEWRLRLFFFFYKYSILQEKMKKASVCIKLYSNFQLSPVIHLTSLWFEIEGSRGYRHSLDFSSV